MKKWLIVGGTATLIAGFTTLSRSDKKVDPEAVNRAISKSLPLLASSSHVFLENAGGCHSCHHQALTAVNFSMAKAKGLTVNDTSLNEALRFIIGRIERRKGILTENDDPTAIVMSGAYDLWALSANHIKPDKKIELMVKNLMQRQTKPGCWVSPSPRPPLEYYSFSATALLINAMLHYGPAYLQAEVNSRMNKARSWLINTEAETTEEKVFQLLGLTWSKADQKTVQKLAKRLLSVQRDDGGWPQLNSLESDAYATGQSLFALNQSGQLRADDDAYQKGVSFLLSKQFDDGSWKVQSRSFPVIPFVETKFPHGKNQFISAAGTNWATMALLLTRK